MRSTIQEIRAFSTNPIWLDIQDKLSTWTLDCLSQMAAGDTTVEEWRHLRGIVEAIENMGNIVEWLCPASLEDIQKEQEQEQEKEEQEDVRTDS